jgi:hypothetical protein
VSSKRTSRGNVAVTGALPSRHRHNHVNLLDLAPPHPRILAVTEQKENPGDQANF